jgi:hypothetical protein
MRAGPCTEKTEKPLRLPEELFLLGHDSSGRPAVHPASLDIGVAGAELTGLALAGRVVVERGRLAVADATPVGRPAADAVVAALVRAPEPPPLGAALARLSEGAGGRVRDRLLADGVLTEVSHRRFGLRPVTRFVAHDAASRVVRVRVWYATHGQSQPDDLTAALCGLVLATLLHDHVFSEMPLPGVADRLREIAAGQAPAVREIGSAVSALITNRAVSIYR